MTVKMIMITVTKREMIPILTTKVTKTLIMGLKWMTMKISGSIKVMMKMMRDEIIEVNYYN